MIESRSDRQLENERKYEQVLKEYEPLLYEIASDYYVPGASKEDLLQEARIALTRAYDSFNDERGVPFSAYAAVCVRRQLQDFVKKQRRKKREVLNRSDSFEETQPKVSSRDPDPESKLLANETLQFLQDVAERNLSGLERKVLTGYLSGESYREIASRMGKDEKSIDNALTRVRRKIARELEQDKLSLRAFQLLGR